MIDDELSMFTCSSKHPATAAVDRDMLISIGAAVVDPIDITPVPVGWQIIRHERLQFPFTRLRSDCQNFSIILPPSFLLVFNFLRSLLQTGSSCECIFWDGNFLFDLGWSNGMTQLLWQNDRFPFWLSMVC